MWRMTTSPFLFHFFSSTLLVFPVVFFSQPKISRSRENRSHESVNHNISLIKWSSRLSAIQIHVSFYLFIKNHKVKTLLRLGSDRAQTACVIDYSDRKSFIYHPLKHAATTGWPTQFFVYFSFYSWSSVPFATRSKKKFYGQLLLGRKAPIFMKKS